MQPHQATQDDIDLSKPVELIALSVTACETVSDTISSINPFEDKGPKSDIGKDEKAEVLFNDGLARLEARDLTVPGDLIQKGIC